MIPLALLGCFPGPPDVPSPGAWVPPGASVGAEAVGGVGDLRARALVRMFDPLGGSVGGGTVGVEVDGVSRDVAVDATGYGEVPFDAPGSYTVRTGISEVEVHVYGAEFPGFGLLRGTEPVIDSDNDATPGGQGILLVRDADLWWASPGSSHRVLAAETDILGVATGHLDSDGVLDAVAWASRTLHVLRGRAGGGMVHAGRIASPDHGVAGATIDDLTGDGYPDIGIAWEANGRGHLDAWQGDGGLTFRPTIGRSLVVSPFDIAVGDNKGEGRVQVTLTVDAPRGWARYSRQDATYTPIGPAIELELLPFTRVASPEDINGDGAADLFFAPPYVPGGERRFTVFDLLEERPTFTSLSRLDAFYALDDFDGDGLEEPVFSEGIGTILALRAGESEALQTDTMALELPSGGPIAKVPGEPRVLLAGQPDWLWLELRPDDGWLTLDDRPLESPGLTLPSGLFEIVELDGDPATIEVVSLRGGVENAQARVWEVTPQGVESLGGVLLEPEESRLVDLDVCGTDAYFLLEQALHRVDIADPSAPVVVASAAMEADRVACGPALAGPVAVLLEESVQILDRDLVQVTRSPTPGAADLFYDAVGPTTCDRTGCGVVRGPVGPDGAIARVVGWPDGAEIDGEPVFGAGLPTIGDVDGNGHVDVLFHHEGRITLYRHTGTRLGPAEIHRVTRPFAGRLGLADLDGDGFLDAWGHEPVNERLRVTPSATRVDDPDPSDTGDTSAPVETGDTAGGSPDTAASTADTGSGGAIGTGDTGATGDTGP